MLLNSCLVSVLAVLLLAVPSAIAKPSTSTSCYSVKVSKTGTRTSSLAPQTRRPTVTSTPVIKSTATVRRPCTSTIVATSTFTKYVDGGTDFVSKTVTPTSFVVKLITRTRIVPTVTSTITDFLITPSPGTFTSTSTTFTGAPAPTIPAPVAPRRSPDDEPKAVDSLEEREECGADEVLEFERRADERVTPGNAGSVSRKLQGRNVFCRRIVRLDPTTVKGSKTKTVTVRETVHPKTITTSTFVITSTRTTYDSASGIVVVAKPTTSTIKASVYVTSTPIASNTVRTTVTVLTPQPTVVVPRLRNVYCGPLARPFTSNLIGITTTDQQLVFPEVPAGSDCCDVAADTPGAIGYVVFGDACIFGLIAATPLADTCVAGGPLTSLLFDPGCPGITPPATCPPAGLLQCASYN